MNESNDTSLLGWIGLYSIPMLVSLGMALAGCNHSEPASSLSAPADETLGETIYGIVCDMVVTGERTTDARGRMAWAVCHEDQEPQRAEWPADAQWDRPHQRIHAIWSNRTRLVSALDAGLPEDIHQPLRGFAGGMLTLFDKPLELLPELTRSVANTLYDLIHDVSALEAMQKLGARQGYEPTVPGQYILEAALGYPALETALANLTQTMTQGGSAHEPLMSFIEAAALEIATRTQDTQVDESEPTVDLRRFILDTENEDYDIGTPCWVLERDTRGLAIPSGLLNEYPALADADNDGLADTDPQGRFLSVDGDIVALPTPFPAYQHLTTALDERDNWGRAIDSSGHPIYNYTNLQNSVLAALVQEGEALLGAGDSQDQTPVLLDIASALPMVLGEPLPMTREFGNYTLEYRGYDAHKSPLVALVDALALLIERPEFEEFLGLIEHLMVNEESTLVSLVELRDDLAELDEVYPDSSIVEGSSFYDELLWFLEVVSRHTGPSIEDSDGDGTPDENQLEALLRAMADPGMEHFGTIGATLMRYKDLISIDPVDINNPPIGTFVTPVDRTQNDYQWFDDQGRPVTNRSIMERLVGLISELDGRGLCNKETGLGDMLAGSAMGGDLGLLSGALNIVTVPECGMIQFNDMVRVFAQVAAGEYQVSIGTGWMSGAVTGLLNAPVLGGWTQDMANGNLERMTGINGFGVRPTPDALARLVFQAPGGFRDATINPLAAKPYHTPGAALPYPDRTNPPEELRITHYYKGTMFAMEPAFQFQDGSSASFFDGMVPLALAINRHDVDPDEADASVLAQTETQGHLFGQLLSLFAKHWPSAQSDELPYPGAYYYGYQDDPTKPYFSVLSDLANTEEYMASMISGDDLAVSTYFPNLEEHREMYPHNANAMGVLYHFLRKLDETEVGKGNDGLDVLNAFLSTALNPHVFCTTNGNIRVGADGRGACHDLIDSQGGQPPEGYPLISRIDGSHVLTYPSSGDVFDGSDSAHPLRPLSVARMLQKAITAWSDLADQPENEALGERFDAATKRLSSAFLQHDGQSFTNRRAYGLGLDIIRFVRSEIEAKRSSGTLSNWSRELSQDIVEAVANPTVATGLSLVQAMADDHTAMSSLGQFFTHLFGGSVPQDWFVAALASSGNRLDAMRDTASLEALRMTLAGSLVPNIQELLDEGESPDTSRSPLVRSLKLTEVLWEIDQDHAVAQMAKTLLSRHPDHADGLVSPMTTLLDVMAEVNRATPNTSEQMLVEDYETWFTQLHDYLVDSRSGLERVISVIQER